jgi:hypothetical protein
MVPILFELCNRADYVYDAAAYLRHLDNLNTIIRNPDRFGTGREYFRKPISDFLR